MKSLIAIARLYVQNPCAETHRTLTLLLWQLRATTFMPYVPQDVEALAEFFQEEFNITLSV